MLADGSDNVVFGDFGRRGRERLDGQRHAVYGDRGRVGPPSPKERRDAREIIRHPPVGYGVRVLVVPIDDVTRRASLVFKRSLTVDAMARPGLEGVHHDLVDRLERVAAAEILRHPGVKYEP